MEAAGETKKKEKKKFPLAPWRVKKPPKPGSSATASATGAWWLAESGAWFSS